MLVRAQDRAGHGIQVVTPITKKSKKQVGVLFVDDTNLWEGLGEDDDIDTVMETSQQSINTWGNNLLAVGGKLRPKKCSYTIHETRPTKMANGNTSRRRRKSRSSRAQQLTNRMTSRRTCTPRSWKNLSHQNLN